MVSWKMKLEEELVVQHHWEERAGGEGSQRGEWGGQGDMGQRVVVGLPRARWWGARKRMRVASSQVSEAPVKKAQDGSAGRRQHEGQSRLYLANGQPF